MNTTLLKHIRALLVDVLLWAYMSLVSYKVIWQRIILDDRYAEFEWREAWISMAAGFGLALALFFWKGFSIGKRLSEKQHTDTQIAALSTPITYITLLLLSLTAIAGFVVTEISFTELFSPKGFTQAIHLFSQLFSPDFSILQKVLLAAVETIYMALMATAFAIPPAFVMSFLTARNLMKGKRNGAFYFLTRLVMNIVRSIEPLIWAIIFSVWVGIGPFAGMLALMVHSMVSLAKLYSEQIEEMDNGPMEAIKATGASNLLVLWYGVVPQILNPFLSFTIYRWDINVRMATIIGMVGGGGIGNILMQYQGMARWKEVGTVVFVIAIIVWAMDYASAKIREILSRG